MSHILTPYLHDLYYAKKHNEQQLWLDNFEADVACVDKINSTFTSSVLGDSLAVDNAFSAITADFGTERLSSILAIHIVLGDCILSLDKKCIIFSDTAARCADKAVSCL